MTETDVLNTYPWGNDLNAGLGGSAASINLGDPTAWIDFVMRSHPEALFATQPAQDMPFGNPMGEPPNLLETPPPSEGWVDSLKSFAANSGLVLLGVIIITVGVILITYSPQIKRATKIAGSLAGKDKDE